MLQSTLQHSETNLTQRRTHSLSSSHSWHGRRLGWQYLLLMAWSMLLGTDSAQMLSMRNWFEGQAQGSESLIVSQTINSASFGLSPS